MTLTWVQRGEKTKRRLRKEEKNNNNKGYDVQMLRHLGEGRKRVCVREFTWLEEKRRLGKVLVLAGSQGSF